MPTREPNDSRIVSVRLPDDLIQRLDRYLDWCATARRRDTTRNAAIREALSAWLDDQEQRAGLVEPHTLRRQFQAAYQSLHPHHDGVPIHRLRQLLQWPRERFDAVLEALRADHHVKRALRLPDWPARPRGPPPMPAALAPLLQPRYNRLPFSPIVLMTACATPPVETCTQRRGAVRWAARPCYLGTSGPEASAGRPPLWDDFRMLTTPNCL